MCEFKTNYRIGKGKVNEKLIDAEGDYEKLSDVNLSALSQDMEVTTTKASALGSFLSIPLSSVHIQDIKKRFIELDIPYASPIVHHN